MQNPLSSGIGPFGGMRVMVVDSGTVVKDEKSDREEIVTDDNAVAKGWLLYCTEKTYRLFKARATPSAVKEGGSDV